MRALVLTTNFRNADNWLGLFQRINAEGGHCELLALPWLGDPSIERFVDLESALPSRVREDIPELSPAGMPEEKLGALLESACRDVDVLFLCDVQSYPSNAVYRQLSRMGRRPVVIGLQHGLFQSWWLYNANFCVDYLFVFGERHVLELEPRYRARAYPVGLPKLDRLKDVPAQAGGHIAYLAQKVPSLDAVCETLSQVGLRAGLDVVVRDHPQYVLGASSSTPSNVSASVGTYLDCLASAAWVLTPHSTGGIEALYLGKTVVLIPNSGLTAWAGYPGIAWDLSADDILAAKGRAESHPNAVDGFLQDVVGGRHFDHVERAWQALCSLMSKSLNIRA